MSLLRLLYRSSIMLLLINGVRITSCLDFVNYNILQNFPLSFFLFSSHQIPVRSLYNEFVFNIDNLKYSGIRLQTICTRIFLLDWETIFFFPFFNKQKYPIYFSVSNKNINLLISCFPRWKVLCVVFFFSLLFFFFFQRFNVKIRNFRK